MSSFGQWSKAAVRGPARVTWVCGSERILVREVIDRTCDAICPDETEGWVAGREREKDIWASVLAIPISEVKRLVMVRDAGRLKDWGKLKSWLDDKISLKGVHLVFVAGEADFPKDSEGKLKEPATWLRDSTVGQIVRCMPLGTEDAQAWVAARAPGMTQAQARHLLDRASGNLREVSNVLSKAAMFSGRLSETDLDLLCSELPGDFADKLIMGERRGALLAADSLGAEGLGMSIGLLASRLDVLSLLHRAARDNVSRRDVVSKMGVPAFLAQKFAGVAWDYGEARVVRCWNALAVVENAYRSGSVEGVAEVLVVSWLGSSFHGAG